MLAQKINSNIKIAAAILGISVASIGNAQDIHFSNMDYSPLTLNPGMAGANSFANATAIYRTQWNSIGAPFTTIAAGGDMRIQAGKSQKNGTFALGVNLFNDRAGETQISTNSGGLTAAYHLKLDDKSTLGLGMQAGFIQRSIDVASGMWSSQYNGVTYDGNLSSGETFGNPSFARFDVGTGFVYSYGTQESRMRSNDKIRINAGYAVFHINRPSYSFFNKEDDPLYMRHAAFANASIGIGQTTMAIDPGIYVQLQGPSREILIGADYKVHLTDGSKVTGRIKDSYVAFGAFYRNGDAAITRIIYTYSDYAFGMSYDFNVSRLSEVSRYRGGMEIFFRWMMLEGGGSNRSRI
jgi:type IX secretion system PorP/SprF family membrane protein